MIINAQHRFHEKRQVDFLVDVSFEDLCLVYTKLLHGTYDGDLFTVNDLPLIGKIIDEEGG